MFFDVLIKILVICILAPSAFVCICAIVVAVSEGVEEFKYQKRRQERKKNRDQR